jgi:hypothetical protein
MKRERRTGYAIERSARPWDADQQTPFERPVWERRGCVARALEAQDAEESWTEEERRALSAHIEEGYQQAERGELIDGAQARREIQAMKDDWRLSKPWQPTLSRPLLKRTFLEFGVISRKTANPPPTAWNKPFTTPARLLRKIRCAAIPGPKSQPVYRLETPVLQVVAVVHGKRKMQSILKLRSW